MEIVEIGQERTFRFLAQVEIKHYFIAQKYLTKKSEVCCVNTRGLQRPIKLPPTKQLSNIVNIVTRHPPGRQIGKCKLSMFAWSLDLDKKLELNVAVAE